MEQQSESLDLNTESLTGALQENQEAEQESQAQESQQESKQNDYESKFSSKFAALSKMEKELRTQREELAQQQAQIQERLKSFEESQKAQEPEEEPLEILLRKNPLEALKKFGWDYEKLTNMQLNDGQLPQDVQIDLKLQQMSQAYEDKIKQLEERLESDVKSREEEKYNQVINNYVNELTDFVNSNEQYELIRANDGVQLVYDVIEQHHAETGEILDNATAADQVEAFLEEEMKSIFKKSKKLSSLSQPQQPVKSQAIDKPTLSNSDSSLIGGQTKRPVSREESLAEVAKLLKWNE